MRRSKRSLLKRGFSAEKKNFLDELNSLIDESNRIDAEKKYH